MMCHLLHYIDELFIPNNNLDLAIEDPIYLKNLTKEYSKGSTKKTLTGWAINMVEKVITLTHIL